MEFVSWNTKADGSGTTYLPGDKFYITETTELYAIWKKYQSDDRKTVNGKTVSDSIG